MAKKNEQSSQETVETLDLFANQPQERLGASLEWPLPDRFPLNVHGSKVQDVILPDLLSSEWPLIVAGYASIDQLIDFCCAAKEQNNANEIKLLIGNEPFDSGRDSYAIKGTSLPEEAESYWLSRGISLLYSAKVVQMLQLLDEGIVKARHLAGPRRMHAKIFIADSAATLGSSNFTDPGLKNQIEANARFDRLKEPKRYRELTQIATNLWENADDYNERLRELLLKLLRVVSWQEALARAAAEMLEGEWAEPYLRSDYLGDAASLWPSQRQGIAQALTILSNQGSVLIADATGAGKTKTGTYLIGAVQDQILRTGRIRQGKAIMICPPAVEENWNRESTLSGVPLDTYSHGKLSHMRSKRHQLTLDALRRAQILCVDEGHNFLNSNSNRTKQVLRNLADHVVLLTATPINRGVTDLVRIADMLGADNLSPSVQQAFGKMMKARSINRSLSEPEIEALRTEIRRFTVRRTKKQLNELVERDPDLYRDHEGNPCRFPKHKPKIYKLGESREDLELAKRVRELSGELRGVLHFRKPIQLPKILEKQGISEKRYLEGRLHSARKLTSYQILSSLRSSKAAVFEHIYGTKAAADKYGLEEFYKSTNTGDVVSQLREIAGTLPENKLKISLPEWLSDADLHQQACENDLKLYQEIAKCIGSMSDQREQSKADHLVQLLSRHALLLAFDSKPISIAYIRNFVGDRADCIMAWGAATKERERIMTEFALGSTSSKLIGLCSDSMSEGVNLQQASALVHLDMPSVVRIAEQRSGRVDRMDTPHASIEIWWPEDAEEFALRTDDRFIERYETVEKLLGSNLPLPKSMRQAEAKPVKTTDMISAAEKQGESWDGIEDAFSPVRNLVVGEDAIIEAKVYEHYREVKETVLSSVSLVSAKEPWALFCLEAGIFAAPRWVMYSSNFSEPETELSTIAQMLRQRLNEATQNLPLDRRANGILEVFLNKLTTTDRKLLARKKQRALEEFEIVLAELSKKANSEQRLKTLESLLEQLQNPSMSRQPDWDKVAAKWLDLIRPVWFERLKSKRQDLLLLKDIRKDLLSQPEWLANEIEKHFEEFPTLKSHQERIKACIVGVN